MLVRNDIVLFGHFAILRQPLYLFAKCTEALLLFGAFFGIVTEIRAAVRNIGGSISATKTAAMKTKS